MKKHGKIIIVVSIIVGLFCLGGLGIYLFFGKKNLSFYRDKDMGEIHAVSVVIEGMDNPEMDNETFWIYDAEMIKELEKQLKEIQLNMNYSAQEIYSETSFSISMLGDNEQSLFLIMDKGNQGYKGYVGMEDNGIVKDGIRKFLGQVTISEEDGDRIYELVKEIIEQQVHKITIEEIQKLSEDKEYDWRKFRQYISADENMEKEKIREGVTSNGVARFEIEGTTGYLLVWYYSGCVYEDGKGTTYEEVIDAVVYNENEETMGLYDENIAAFLEDMR